MNKNIVYSILFEEDEEDYHGSHRAPRKDGAPLWDITINDVYPDDFYTLPLNLAARYYGHSQPGDNEIVAIVRQCYKKPKAKIKIYRTVPEQLNKEQQINKLEVEKKYIMRTGKLPKTAEGIKLSPNKYYEHLSVLINQLEQQIEQPTKPYIINDGDWVTLYKPYAKKHGESSLFGKYKILSKTVRVDQLFTDGNSIYEWGYVES